MSSKMFCDGCGKELDKTVHWWDFRASAPWEESGNKVFSPHNTYGKDACSAACFLKLVQEMVDIVRAKL